jgi:hypothetical protein
MNKRLELHEKLVQCLGNSNVYFQPPENMKLQYPAITYSLDDIRNNNADDEVYKQSYHYQLTVIHKDSDNEVVKTVSRLSKVRFNRHFKSDNLNHYVFTIYY